MQLFINSQLSWEKQKIKEEEKKKYLNILKTEERSVVVKIKCYPKASEMYQKQGGSLEMKLRQNPLSPQNPEAYLRGIMEEMLTRTRASRKD